MDAIWQFFGSKAGIILLVFAALFAAERLFPVARSLGGLWRVARNLVLAGFNFIASPLIVIPVTALAAGHGFDWRPAFLSGWTGLAFDVVVLDCWIYWWHRANHIVPLLWRFHEVHHLDETLDTTTALRFHFGEVILSALVRAGVVLLLAVPLSSVIAFETLIAISALFQHSNLRLPAPLEKAISLVFVTPSIHWVHHHAIRRDTDSNYSTLFSWWDLLFGSRSATPRTPELTIGVEAAHDVALPRLLLRPFRR